MIWKKMYLKEAKSLFKRRSDIYGAKTKNV